MRGLGKPGVHQAQISYQGMPRNIVSKKTGSHMGMFERLKGTKYGDRLLKPHSITPTAWGKQMIPKTMIEKAINEGKIDFYGTGGHEVPTSDQFVKYSYPIPKEKGGTEIHMIWTDTPCRITCWNCGNDVIETVRSPKIEFVLAQHPWLENDCLYADIILPIKTIVETDDISPCVRDGESFQSLVRMKPAIPPIGEALSNYEAVCEIAKKLNMYDEVTEKRSVPDLIKDVFYGLGFGDYISYEEFEEKGYYVLPVAEDWEDDVAGLYNFYKDPEKNPLPTPSGKLEFYSERIAKHFPDDKERGPYPKWIERSETHDERISSERAKLYPLLLMSNHGRWRVHAQCDDITWTREAYTGKVLGFDGYKYEPCWINPHDAKARGIKDGDIVKVFNERGGVLCGARVFERVMPGVVSVDHGARADAIIPGKLDRGGAINTVTPAGLTSKNCAGQATSGFLVDIEKVTPEQMGKWMNDYPDAFNREYDPDSGLRFDAWVEGRK
jgi:trimethylamine-N-oxide reductase (cytochrome c)